MESDSTGSSDSELESKLKLNLTDLSQKCLFCKKSGVLVKGTQKTLSTFVQAVNIREEIKNITNTTWVTVLKQIEEGDTENIKWHKSCYSSFTSKKNIDVLRKKLKYSQSEKVPDVNVDVWCKDHTLRKQTFDNNKCIFCQKRSNKRQLCQVLTKNCENKIKFLSIQSPNLLQRIGSNDLIAVEAKYHAYCYNIEWYKHKPSTSSSNPEASETIVDVTEIEAFEKIVEALRKGFEKGKGFDTTEIFETYKNFNGSKSKKTLIRSINKHFGDKIENIKSVKLNEANMIIPKLTKHETIHSHMEASSADDCQSIYNATSETSLLHKVCDDIKTQMRNIPDFKQFKNLDTKAYKQLIPKGLILIVSLLISDEENLNEDRILSICQDVIFAYSKNKKFTPKHIGLGVMLHQETRSKKMIETLNSCGHCISYKDVLRIRNSVAHDEIKKYVENDNVVIPRQLIPNRFLHFAADNIDILEETLDKSPTFHGTQMMVFQKGPPNEDITQDFELLPHNTKLNIPENFHELRKLNHNKSVKPLPLIENKMAIEENKNESYIWQHNMSWALCRMSNTDFKKDTVVVPQWSGFNKLLSEDNVHVTSYGYLPLLPYVASEYDTVWTTMKRCNSIAQKLNVKYTVITFDQAIYFKAKEIQWIKSEECKNYVVRLGGFHIMLNFLKVIGQFMQNSGLSDVWIESNLYGAATTLAILEGRKWNKAIRAHKLTYESLLRILIKIFEEWLVDCNSDNIHSINFARLMSNELCNNISINKPLAAFIKIVDVMKGLKEPFKEFKDAQLPTFRYWLTYIELVEILLEFLYSERTGNWDLHLTSFRKMLPWFFIFDHTNYSRWGPVYLTDMLNLPHKAPAVHAEFLKGEFVVKRLQGKFNLLSVDQALEHVNKTSKDAGGIVGITKNSTRMDEWFLSFNEIGEMIHTFLFSLQCSQNSDPVSQNIEIGAKRMMIDEESVVRLLQQFNRFKVFHRNEVHLICISTNEIIDDNLSVFLINASAKGEEELQKFIEIMDSSDFYKPIKTHRRIKLHTDKSKLEIQEKKKVRAGQDFLQQILAAKEMGRQVDYKQVFKYELTPFPMSIATNTVSLSTPSNKSALGNIIEQNTTSVKVLPFTCNKVCHIFDGMSVVQRLGKPAKLKTFGEYAQLFTNIIFKNEFGAERIDVVFDHYEEKSIKSGTRFKRGSSIAINRIIDSDNVPLPQQWNLFIHSVFNKNQLTDFLSHTLLEHSQKYNIQFATGGGFHDILNSKSNRFVDTTLNSNHEEADTRILLHILSAKQAGFSRSIIDCQDTDVLVLLAHFKQHLTPEVWMKVGYGDSRRFIAVHSIVLDLQLLKSLPAFHALTGCDTTSQLSNYGKKSCWKVYISNANLLNDVGIGDFTETLFACMHDFLLKLYTTNPDIHDINDLRGILAASKTIDKLPPTKDALRLHCLRVHYQTKIWLNSLKPQPILPDITSHGWIILDDKVTPHLTILPSTPEDIKILSTCGCRKDCASKSCSCKKNKICCIGSCKCMGQKACKNSSEIIIPPLIVTDEDSSDSD